MRNGLIIFFLAVNSLCALPQTAPAPLFRDPIYDGAADPMVIWNNNEKSWWMLYTGRRANQDAADVAYCYGTRVGVASSSDHGLTWVFRGYLDLEFENGMNTFWAPDVIYFRGVYHMFVTYIRGAYSHWGGEARIIHYTSADMWSWKYEGPLELTSKSVIDATLLRMNDGKFRIWYKDQERGSVTMTALSEDLKNWVCDDKPAIGGDGHEGPNAFRFMGFYWMITDEWRGLRVYRSSDLTTWEKQNLILDSPSEREDDTPQGAHADVEVLGDKAYIFYFTHPGRSFHTEGEPGEDGVLQYSLRRSSIQVAELKVIDGVLICNRSEPFNFFLPDLDW